MEDGRHDRIGNAPSRPAGGMARLGAGLTGRQARHGLGDVSGKHDDPVPGARKPQNLNRQLLDHIRIGGVDEADLLFQAGALGLEARDLRLQLARAFDQTTARLKATLTDDGMIGEVAQPTDTEKRHQNLSRPALAPIVHGSTCTYFRGATRDLVWVLLDKTNDIAQRLSPRKGGGDPSRPRRAQIAQWALTADGRAPICLHSLPRRPAVPRCE